MKKGKIIALVLAAVAAIFAFLLLGKGKNEDDRKTVVVASADIKAGSKISEKALAIEKVPSKYALKGSVSEVADVAGKIADIDIKKGEQILSDKIVSTESGEGALAYKVPRGKRAVSFRVNDESSLDGNLRPGNRVDVSISMPLLVNEEQLKIQVGESAAIEGISGFQSKYLAENVEVLFVGADTVGSGTVNVNVTGSENGDSVKASSAIVILAVTPEEALLLNTEKYQTDLKLGKFSLTLRGYEDDSTAEPKQVSVQFAQ